MVDWLERPLRLRLASADRWSLGSGEAATPTSSPTDVWPVPSPQDAFPVGSTTVKAAAMAGVPAAGNECSAAAERERTPRTLLVTERPMPVSLTCPLARRDVCRCRTTEGAAGDATHRGRSSIK